MQRRDSLRSAYAPFQLGWLADKWNREGYLVDNHSVRTVLATVAFLQAAFFLGMTQLEGVAALRVAIAFMLVVFGQIPINDVLVGRIAHSDWRSRAYALRYIHRSIGI